MSLKKVVSIAGTLLMLVSLVFIGRQLMQHGMDFSVITVPVVIGLIAIIALEAFIIILTSLNYRDLIKNISNIRVSTSLALSVYTISNLYKYIPGGLLYVAGRNRLALEIKDVSHVKVALATALEAVLFVVTCVTLVAALIFDHFVYYLGEKTIIVFVGILVVFIMLALIFRERIKLNVIEKPLWLTIVKRFLNTLLLMILWGASFGFVTIIMGQAMTVELFVAVMGLYSLAWLIGDLTPGAPSGLGIREAIMLMFLGGTIDEGLLISVILVHRVVAVLGDVLAYVIAVIFNQLSS